MHPDAKTPTCAHPGKDLGFDLYALEDVTLQPGVVTMVRTGIALSYVHSYPAPIDREPQYGLVFEDRSGHGSKGVIVLAGIIDAGFNEEVKVLLLNTTGTTIVIPVAKAIVQALPQLVHTAEPVVVVDKLPSQVRGGKGFGSSDYTFVTRDFQQSEDPLSPHYRAGAETL